MIQCLIPLVNCKPVSPKSLLILSTTKGNISLLKNETEPPHGVFLMESAKKIARYFGFKTSPAVISNACFSGVLSISAAKNFLQNDTYDDVYIIAGDEVTDFVLSGFNTFQAMSETPCIPYDKERSGISIGEAMAAVYVHKKPRKNGVDFEIFGDSVINDANHISEPHRTGEGLYKSIVNAMREALITPEQVDYISAHGTATLYNDEMESFAFSRAGLSDVPMNGLKGYMVIV